jgi:hypothetical protein
LLAAIAGILIFLPGSAWRSLFDHRPQPAVAIAIACLRFLGAVFCTCAGTVSCAIPVLAPSAPSPLFIGFAMMDSHRKPVILEDLRQRESGCELGSAVSEVKPA